MALIDRLLGAKADVHCTLHARLSFRVHSSIFNRNLAIIERISSVFTSCCLESGPRFFTPADSRSASVRASRASLFRFAAEIAFRFAGFAIRTCVACVLSCS